MTGFEHPLARAALKEVVELHAFFEAWLGGTGPCTGAAFARLEEALGESFSMVSPDGKRVARAEVIAQLRQAYGSRGRAGRLRMAILEPEVLVLDPPVVIIGYVEEQDTNGALTRRRSTAVLGAAVQDAGRLRWLALHETWIENPATAALP